MSIGGRVHIAAEVGAATAVRTMAAGTGLDKNQSSLLYDLRRVGDRVFLVLRLDRNNQVLRHVSPAWFQSSKGGRGPYNLT